MSECVIDTCREQTLEDGVMHDAYWVQCVRTDEHDCTTEPRMMFKRART